MTTATTKLSGNRAGWLVAVAKLVMEGGDKPPSRTTLYRRASKLVGPTAINDGHVTAALNGLPRSNTAAGQRLFVDFWVNRLREEGWVSNDDDALRWTGPLTGDMTINVDGTDFLILDPEESVKAKDESKVADVLSGRGHINRVQFFKKNSDEVAIASRTGLPMRRDLKVHPLALTIPQMTGAELELLRKDVQAFGIREPLMLFEDLVLDGRHRLYMASEYDLPVHLEEFKGDEAAARQYVFSANIIRRHLTVAQRTLAVKELFMPEAERRAAEAKAEAAKESNQTRSGYRPEAVTENGSDGSDRGKSATQIASEMSGGLASARSLERMKEVDREKTPNTVAAVDSGEVKSPTKAGELAAIEREGSTPDLPENKPTRTLASRVRTEAKRFLKAVKDPDGKGGVKRGETVKVAEEARAILNEAIEHLQKTGPA